MKPSIQLASGRFFDYTSFTEDDIHIEDIAAALSKLCRFTGHCRTFYSVAQHSWLVSHNVPQEHALTGLLHDGTEAYINDLARPLKLLVPEYVALEHRLWPAIARRFWLPEELPPCVKHADNVLLVTEQRDLMTQHSSAEEWHWARDIPRLPGRIVPWSPELAEAQFLSRYKELEARREAA